MFCEISIFTNMSRIRRPMRCAHTAGLPRYRFAIRSAFAIVCHGQFAFHSRHDVVSKRSKRVFGGDVQSARLCQIAASRRAYRESDSPPLKIECVSYKHAVLSSNDGSASFSTFFYIDGNLTILSGTYLQLPHDVAWHHFSLAYHF